MTRCGDTIPGSFARVGAEQNNWTPVYLNQIAAAHSRNEKIIYKVGFYILPHINNLLEN